jgi:MFS transporter, FSR family, fosmidomycin resistance protein
MQELVLKPNSDRATVRAEHTVFAVILAVSFCHLLNDMMQALLPAIYPTLKVDFGLSFGQVGIVTLAYQITASILQPLVGLYADRRPTPLALSGGTLFSLAGLMVLSIAHSYGVLLVGASLAFFALLALVAGAILWNVGVWYKQHGLARLSAGASRKNAHPPLPLGTVRRGMSVLLVLVFSKYVYLASLTSYFTFYLIHRFGLSVRDAQLELFAFSAAVAVGTMLGGPFGDRIGRKRVIWFSILGTLPFTLALPYASLFWTGPLVVMIGLILASAFPAIVVFAQELAPGKVGMVSGLFFGLAFGVGGLGAAALGVLADAWGIERVYGLCSYLPALGLFAALLPNIERRRHAT